jgi:styrene-oxide isomerase
MAGHGILMIFSTLIAGLVLWAKPLGGWDPARS